MSLLTPFVSTDALYPWLNVSRSDRVLCHSHGCTYDPRNGKIAVSDRANSRFEYFDFDMDSPDRFEYSHTVDQKPSMGAGTLPCNLRMVSAAT